MVICFFALLTLASFYCRVLGYVNEDMVRYGWGLFYGVYNPTCNYWMYDPETDLATAKSYSFALSILTRAAGVLEMLSDFRRNLMVCHLVDGFHTHDASAEVVFFQPLFQFALSLARAEYQNGFGITNTRNDRLIVNVEMGRKRSLAAIACRYLLFVIGSLQR